MAELIFLVIVVAFFALAAALVVGCDRILGPDDSVDQAAGEPSAREEVRA